MGRSACTKPQCLHKGALYLYLTLSFLYRFKEIQTLENRLAFLCLMCLKSVFTRYNKRRPHSYFACLILPFYNPIKHYLTTGRSFYVVIEHRSCHGIFRCMDAAMRRSCLVRRNNKRASSREEYTPCINIKSARRIY